MLTQLFKHPTSFLSRVSTWIPTIQPRATFFFLPRSGKGKSHYYKLELKAKRRRMRRGKTGGPPKGVDTFRTFIGKTKDVPFLKPKPGFPRELLGKTDPQHMVKLSDIVLNQSLK